MSYRPPTRPLPTAHTPPQRPGAPTLAAVYRYRCEQCATTSPPVRTRTEVDRLRDRHRAELHGGFIPDGERLQQTVRAPGSDRTALISLAVIAVILIIYALV